MTLGLLDTDDACVNCLIFVEFISETATYVACFEGWRQRVDTSHYNFGLKFHVSDCDISMTSTLY